MARIEIAGLSKSFGGVTALSDLSMVVEDGEFVTLLGPSGCGKTTTLNLLAGFLPPDAGTVKIDERVVSAPGHTIEPENRGMGMVFQNYALWPHKTVFGNVAYGLQRQKRGRGETRGRVEAMLDLVGLAGYGDRYPDQLSGGQQQRVALARSLVTEPSILLLDEPLSNLDAKLRESMRYEVQRIQRQLSTTFVYVTHDQVEAMSMSDRIAVLEDGCLRQFAPPREVYLRPADAFVADFMGLINFVPGRVVETQGQSERVGVSLDVDEDCVVAVSPPEGAEPPTVGAPVAVALRPEVFKFADAVLAQGRPCLTGEVVHAVVLGNITYYQVAIGDCTLRVQAGHDVEITVGSTATLLIDDVLARVFPLDEVTARIAKLSAQQTEETLARAGEVLP